MKILLISPLIQECNYIGDYFARWPHLGLTYIASALEQKGHQVMILERKLLSGPEYPNTEEKMARVDRLMLNKAEDFKPELVGLTATTPVIMDAYRAANAIKSVYAEMPIVIGGRHATSEPVYTLEQCPDIDIACQGEGEITMLELAEGLAWNKIKGIMFRKHKRGKDLTENPARPPIEDLDALPFPAWHLLDENFYFQPNISVMRGDYMRTATIMTSRGCPYRCAFCQSPELLDRYGKEYVRYHSADRVISEIKYLMDRFKVTGISFNDDMFSLKKERVLEICNKLVSLGINRHLKFTVNLRADRVDDEILLALKKAGCIHIIFGCESGSDTTLKRMNKGLTVSKNISAVGLTKRNGLAAEVNIVIGSPHETESGFLETIAFLKVSKPDKIFVSKFYPLPGTLFYRQLLDEGTISRPKDWNEINDLYVENDNFTFAKIPPDRFITLRNKLSREVVLLRNFLYLMKSNFTNSPNLVIIQMIKLFLYLSFFYLPVPMEKLLKKAAGSFNGNLRYFFRK